MNGQQIEMRLEGETLGHATIQQTGWLGAQPGELP